MGKCSPSSACLFIFSMVFSLKEANYTIRRLNRYL